jgi:hypothetical protein
MSLGIEVDQFLGAIVEERFGVQLEGNGRHVIPAGAKETLLFEEKTFGSASGYQVVVNQQYLTNTRAHCWYFP